LAFIAALVEDADLEGMSHRKDALRALTSLIQEAAIAARG
jgi:hypothetical protein